MDIARKLAVMVVKELEEKEGYSNIVLNHVIEQNRKNMTEKDVGFLSELVYGVVTWKLTIDTILQKHASIKLKKMSPWVLAILRVGAYQILFLDKVPKASAVDESVKICKKYAYRSSGFINAILRKIEKREKEELNNITDPIKRISVTTSMPEWIVEKLYKEIGEKQTEKVCEASCQKPGLSLRVNLLKVTKEELKQHLEQENIIVQDGLLSSFLTAEKVKNMTALKSYQKGEFTVQDEAAGLTSLLLNPKPGDTVLDCCSAPGGKTTHLAEIMKNTGSIMAWDVYDERLEKVRENAKRLGITIIKTEKQDASLIKHNQIETYDCVLLDVPCLGLGVLKRKPDIKWQKKPEDIETIAKVQEAILETASQYVKKGGRMLYSTCSILQEENHEQIEKFLTNHPNFTKIEIEEKEILTMIEKQKEKGEIQLYQNEKHDGFYMCLLKKMH